MMRRAALAALLACLTAAGTRATELSCAQAAAIAEASAAIPAGLLLAIGIVESGRNDATGARAPWPWTIQGGGVGRFVGSAYDAVTAVQQMQAGGLQSIDIGCFQMNIYFHPDAFRDLASGFDPLTNALAAAHFLTTLYAEFGNWEQAVAAYHSRNDMVGAAYRDQVLSVWRGKPPDPAYGATIMIAGVRVWEPGRSLVANILPAPQRMPRVVTPSLR